MQTLTSHIALVFDKCLFTKDPMSSSIGQAIVRESVEMMASQGLDHFTFKKLAHKLDSTESTIYRYFQNKNQLANYLASWHWSQLEWRIAFATANISDPKLRLQKAIHELCVWVKNNPSTRQLNEAKLQQLVINTGFSAFVPADLSKAEREGYLAAYSFLINRLAEIIKVSYQKTSHPHSFATLLIEAIQHQMFLQLNAPSLTDIKGKEDQIEAFILQIFLTETI